MEIKVLSKETIDRIAAGEVVERPFNVVKELVENSMDAGSRSVSVEISGGGTSLIRVTDDGCGIPKGQLCTAFLRHATSKIRDSEDLLSIKSLGFRGEALSSIGAVSRISIVTKTKDSLTASEFTIEGGIEGDIREIGAPEGTTIVVRDLFYNVPARKKFLRSDTSEAGMITDLMEQLALSHPEISFKYTINKKQRFSTPGKGDLKDVIYRLYGRDFSKNIIPVHGKSDTGLPAVSGYIGTPMLNRGVRSFEHFFINGRFIKDEVMRSAVEEAYRPYLMQHRFPFCVLHLTIDPAAVDINVHPSKQQVRFSDPDVIYDLIKEACAASLKDHEMLNSVSFFEKEERREADKEHRALNKVSAPEPFEYKRREEALFAGSAAAASTGTCVESSSVTSAETSAGSPAKVSDTMIVNTADVGEWDIDFSEDAYEDSAENHVENQADDFLIDSPILNDSIIDRLDGGNSEPEGVIINEVHFDDPEPYFMPVINNSEQLDMFTERLIDPALRHRYRIIGQLFNTYFLIEYKDELLIMDQHAAHEKVRYEEIMRSVRESVPDTQMLMPSVAITLQGSSFSLYEEYADYFARLGFEIEDFGDSTIALRGVPARLYGRSGEEFFMDIMDELSSMAPGLRVSGDTPTDEVLSKIASMSCKAAVKGGSPLSIREAESLLDQLLELDNPYHCPHGRPTIITMSRRELEKRFGRIV